jgi:hypothetical protein
MVKFWQTIPPSPALSISLYPQDANTRDAPEAMVKFSSHEQVQEQMTLPKESHGIFNSQGTILRRRLWLNMGIQVLLTKP